MNSLKTSNSILKIGPRNKGSCDIPIKKSKRIISKLIRFSNDQEFPIVFSPDELKESKLIGIKLFKTKEIIIKTKEKLVLLFVIKSIFLILLNCFLIALKT